MVLPFSPSPLMQPPGAMTPVPAGPPFGSGAAPLPPPGPFGGPPGGVIDAEYRLLLDATEASLAPEPPPYYVPGGKPDAKTIHTEAIEQRELHAARVLKQAWMDMLLGMEISAIFPSDELFVELKEIEPQSSQLLRLMHDAIVNFVAAQTIQFTSLATGLVMREERNAIEVKLVDSMRCWKEQHYREGQGSLIRTLTADALSGMVAVYHAPDPGDKRSGQRRYRVDPKVVYPVFGRDGLDRVYTLYEATYPEVLRDFGDGPGGPATKTIQSIARKGKGRGSRDIDITTCHELTGYWDREYGIVLWKGEVIREWHHQLWVCPWHVGLPNWRNNASLKTHSPYLWTPGQNAPLDDQGLRVGGSTREIDLARAIEPFLTPWVGTKDKFEKLLTRYMYAADMWLNHPKVYNRSSASSSVGAPEVQAFRHGVTELEGTGPDAETLDYLPMPPSAEHFVPLWEMLKVEIQASIPVPLLQGQSIGTQSSGNAIDAINDMGYAHFSPVVEFMPTFLGDLAHRELVYTKDWAPAYDPADPLSGGLSVPSATNYQIKLTREMLERAGCYVECSMRRFSLSSAASMATTASILYNQLHVGTQPYWVSELGMSAMPHQFVDERMMEDLDYSPGFVESRAIEMLYDEALHAMEIGDEESARRLMIRARRVAAKQAAHDMATAKVGGMLAGQPEPMAGELPGNAGQPGGNPMPFLSAPDMGRATGTQGGAPAAAVPLPGQG